jgi:hypothetical protein
MEIKYIEKHCFKLDTNWKLKAVQKSETKNLLRTFSERRGKTLMVDRE